MIKEEEVEHIANLARLGLTKEEIKRFQKEISSILAHFDFLKKVDVSKVNPTFHPTEDFFEKELAAMRKDKPEPENPERVNKMIEAAPKKFQRHLKIKAVF